MQFIENIPPDFINFALVTIFSLLIGLEQRWFHADVKEGQLFGTDRTYTFIGILGFVSYIISPHNLVVFVSAGFAIVGLLAIFYYQKIKNLNLYGLTSIILALLTYSLAPLLYTKPLWLTILLVTIILILTELKDTFWKLTSSFGRHEFISLAKFLIIAGIILPLLPTGNISSFIPMSPFKIWLVVVVISSVSYLSYILQKFVFPQKGIYLASILGGLYSSTVTTIVLAKKSKSENLSPVQTAGSISLATSMMYIRIFIFALIFNISLAKSLLPYLAILELIALLTAAYFIYFKTQEIVSANSLENNQNPLEFKTAIVFAMLFLFISLITTYTLQYYGNKGLNTLALIVGVSDITPFILNLFTGDYQVSTQAIILAALLAITSNSIIKMVYAIVLSNRESRKFIVFSFSTVILASISISLWLASV